MSKSIISVEIIVSQKEGPRRLSSSQSSLYNTMQKNDYTYVTAPTLHNMNPWVPQNFKFLPTCQTYLTTKTKKQLAPKISNFNRVAKQ